MSSGATPSTEKTRLSGRNENVDGAYGGPPPSSSPEQENGPRQIPRAIAGPLEAVLSFIGRFVTPVRNVVASRSMSLSSGARPWMEFLDLSAMSLSANGFSEYLSRLKINARWYLLNYLMLGLALAAVSVITKPFALIGALVLIYVYFRLFGSAATESATPEGETRFLGLLLDDQEKAGFLVVLSVLVFWLTTDGVELVLAVITGTLLVAVIHGSLRRPHYDAVEAQQQQQQPSNPIVTQV